MIKLIAICLILFSGFCFAANKDEGKRKYQSTCVACHGSIGISTSEVYPNLAGQKKTYLIKQLNDFKSGTRKDSTMKAYANMLTEEDIKNIAAYLSELKCNGSK